MPVKVTLQSSGQILTSNGRRQFLARLVTAGRIVTASGDPGPITIPPEAIQTAINQFNGLAVFIDHPKTFENASVRQLVGVTHSAVFNHQTQSADAVIRFYVREEQEGANPAAAEAMVSVLDMMAQDAQEGLPVPNVGISLVFWPHWQTGEKNAETLTLAKFKKIDSADIVFSPAADGRILQALSASNFVPTGEEIMEPEETQEPIETPINPITKWEAAAAAVAGRQIIENSGLPQTARDRLLKQRFSNPDDVYNAIEQEEQYLAALAQNEVIQLPGRHPRGAGGSQIFMTTPLDHARNAVDYMFGVATAQPPEPMLRQPNYLYFALTGDYEWYGRFDASRAMFTGADTATLANMAADSMNKVIMTQLALLTFYRWYEHIAVPTPNDGSLHDMDWVSMGGITTLPVVTEKGSYDELTVDDVKETDAFIKYGGYVGITREMLRKSQIQQIQAIPKAIAAASVKTRSAKIAEIFTSNSGVGPTLDQDSTALFHSNHANVATTALGTDMTAWRAAALACFKQTEVSSGDRIGVFPKFCLVPGDLYHQALANFGYGDGEPTTYLPEGANHELRNNADPRPVPLAVPHFTDATDWAFITDPRIWPVIHMSFSADPSGRSFPAPELFSVVSETAGLMFTNDTLPIKVRDEFAYGVNGYRGIGKRNVA